ncbi:10844_t:CDS:2, partial [Rhizophagus irregularis]
LYAAIKDLPETRQVSFHKECIEIFNKRWKQFDIELYVLAFILHPKYRMKTSTFRKVIEYGIREIWLKMGGGKNFSQILIGQFSNYRNRKAPYDHQFIDEIYTVQSWWTIKYDDSWASFPTIVIHSASGGGTSYSWYFPIAFHTFLFLGHFSLEISPK